LSWDAFACVGKVSGREAELDETSADRPMMTGSADELGSTGPRAGRHDVRSLGDGRLGHGSSKAGEFGDLSSRREQATWLGREVTLAEFLPRNPADIGPLFGRRKGCEGTGNNACHEEHDEDGRRLSLCCDRFDVLLAEAR